MGVRFNQTVINDIIEIQLGKTRYLREYSYLLPDGYSVDKIDNHYEMETMMVANDLVTNRRDSDYIFSKMGYVRYAIPTGYIQIPIKKMTKAQLDRIPELVKAISGKRMYVIVTSDEMPTESAEIEVMEDVEKGTKQVLAFIQDYYKRRKVLRKREMRDDK